MLNFASHLFFFFSERILLRVKLLYFLRHEVIGKLGPKIKEGCNARYVIMNSFSFDLYAACWCCVYSVYVVVQIYPGHNLVFTFVLVYGSI